MHFIIKIQENQTPWKGSAAMDSVGCCATFERTVTCVPWSIVCASSHSSAESEGDLELSPKSLLSSLFGVDRFQQVGDELLPNWEGSPEFFDKFVIGRD